VRALDAVSLTVPRAQRVALIGHNGAGKSTLIKLMLGLIRPTRGTAIVLDAEATSAGFIHARKAIGFLPESIVFPDGMTGAEVLAFYARLKHQPVSKNAALFERVGLAQVAKRRVGTYSKGMRQRLGLAQALIGLPRLLLLDEPTSGLDPSLRKEVYEIIGELARDGATVLLSSHALAEIEPEVDRVVALINGRKAADETIAGLRQSSSALARIRVRLARGAQLPDATLACAASHNKLSNGVTEIRCRESEKLSILRRLAAPSIPLADIEVVPATLEDIYADILRREEAK
jgi:Cu-processing system ATP-binding protein